MLDKLKIPERHYLNEGHSLRSWLLTKDHKRIAIMYLISISIMFFLGMATLLLIVLGLGMLRAGVRRARAHRAERRELGELSTKLDAYKRAEQEEGKNTDADERR